MSAPNTFGFSASTSMVNPLLEPPQYELPTPLPPMGPEHPLWELEVQMERGMLRDGADRVRDRVVKATERRQMTRLAPVRGLLTDWLPAVAEGLKDWVKAMDRSKGGPKPLALRVLRPTPHEWETTDGKKRSVVLADPHVMALVALRSVLDGVTTERTAITALAVQIGRDCEHEQKIRLWEAQDPDLFYGVQDHLDRTDATSNHRKRVNINRFNHLVESGQLAVAWEPWSQELLLRVGLALIDTIIRATMWFELQPDPSFKYKPGTKKGPKLVLVAKPGLTEWLASSLDTLEMNSPAYKPTVIPPKPWEDTRKGGYWTHYVRTPRLIRFKAHQEEQKDRAADEYEALDMPLVYEAINYLQGVPWRVNKAVFEVMSAVQSQGLGLGGVPLTVEVERPQPIAEDEKDEEVVKRYKRAVAAAIRKDMSRLAEVLTFNRTFSVAHEYKDLEEFYFPHMMDFRGRMYPIPVGLQPQGADIARGLLEFADGKPIERDADVAWLAVHVSACWGYDKASFEDRVRWTFEREDLWRRIAADPLGNLEWADTKKVDKPWCLLAAIFEWVALLDHGLGYVSHLPVSVDGTCNGIQHLSAMTRDAVAGTYVNLVPGSAPRDIYKFVAQKLQAVLEETVAGGGAHAEAARYWLEVCAWDLPRGLTKRQVMVLPYGGTKDAFFKYTREWLDENDPLPEDLDWKDPAVKAMLQERTQRISLLVLRLWDVVKEVCSGGMEVMEWLQACAKQTVGNNQPIFWTTPSGFVVRHFYGKQEERLVKTMLSGERVRLTVQEPTPFLDAASQLRGIAPNFVHSLDAAALTLSLISAKVRGITAFTSVHDAYGTHATDMWALYDILREAFVLVHAGASETGGGVLATYRQACQAVVVAELLAERPDLDPLAASELADERLPKLPAMGDLDLADVLSSDYFFS